MRKARGEEGESPGGAVATAREASAARSRVRLALVALVVLALAQRALYLLSQPAHDPFLAHPFVDGKLYLEHARAILAGSAAQAGAFYHAPLYPYVLAGMLELAGGTLRGALVVQALLSLGTAALLGRIAWRRFGPWAGIATGALLAFHQPLVFFAATPMGETVALFLLAAALLARERRGAPWRAAAGLLLGLSVLARPNFLLVGLLLGVVDLARRDWRRAAAFALGAAVAILPVTVRNHAASGHLVLVSSNGGVTFFHGNGPGARGIYHAIPGTTGDPARQRDETTAIARRESGQDLDPVEADAWWGRRARAERLAHPAGTLGLLLRRASLTLSNRELALDYDPALDEDPWRPVLRLGGDTGVPGAGLQVELVPFALLLGLALTALVARGARASGGVELWGAALACAATPVLFYVSSRYRLPFAALLALPAGAGLAALVDRGVPVPRRRAAALAGGAVLLASVLLPVGDLARTGLRQSLSNRLGALTQAGDYAAAERVGRAALALGDSYELRFNLGYLYQRMGRESEARTQLAAAFAADPKRPEAARALGVLLAREKRYADALAPLEAAAADGPHDPELWSALAASYRALGRTVALRDTLARARAAGVVLREQ